MNSEEIFLDNIRSLSALLPTLASLAGSVFGAGKVAAECIKENRKIFFCGNGGSAADSQHLAAELTGRFMNERRPLPAIAVTTDTSALTCIGNDYSFDEIFARQVAGLGRPGDVLVAISTSGNSTNVIRAVEEARSGGLVTIGLLGRDGGALGRLCDHTIIVPSNNTARIQECHILIGHTLCGLIEMELGLA